MYNSEHPPITKPESLLAVRLWAERTRVQLCMALAGCISISWAATGNVDIQIVELLIEKLGETDAELNSVADELAMEDPPLAN